MGYNKIMGTSSDTWFTVGCNHKVFKTKKEYVANGLLSILGFSIYW